MTTITAPRPAGRRSSVPARVGVVLAAVQGLGDLALGVAQFRPDGWGYAIATLLVAAGSGALALLVPAWRGTGWAAVLTGVLIALASLTALPGFFMAGVPVAMQIGAALTIVLAVVTLVLLLVPVRR